MAKIARKRIDQLLRKHVTIGLFLFRLPSARSARKVINTVGYPKTATAGIMARVICKLFWLWHWVLGFLGLVFGVRILDFPMGGTTTPPMGDV